MASLSQIDFATISEGSVWVGGDLDVRSGLTFKAWTTSVVVVQGQEVVPCSGLGGPSQGTWWGSGDVGLLKVGQPAMVLAVIVRAYVNTDEPQEPPVTEVFTWTETRRLTDDAPPEHVH